MTRQLEKEFHEELQRRRDFKSETNRLVFIGLLVISVCLTIFWVTLGSIIK